MAANRTDGRRTADESKQYLDEIMTASILSDSHIGRLASQAMQDLDHTAAERLRAAGQRYTRSRSDLVELLATSEHPMTIPEILQRDPALPQSSVYRNLTVLEEAGLVQRITTSDEWTRFELAEDLTEHHHHQICAQCGQVRDFVLPTRLERSIDDGLAQIAAQSGFTLQHHRLDLVGVCSVCTTG